MNIMNLYVYENRSMSNDLSKPLMLENLNVDTAKVHIPKEIDGTDMGTWAWWFVYQNAKREKYSIPMTLEGTTSDDGEEEYISTVGLNHGFTGKHGTVMYAIEAIQADGSGAVTHEWHTKTYKLEIVYTLQGNQTEYDESESDIISALISRVNELIQSGAEIAEIAETIENAAETAQEVIDSIPADYSALSAQVDTNTEDIGGLKADLDVIDSVLKTTKKRIKAAYIDSNGEIKSSSTYDTICFEVLADTVIGISNTATPMTYGFYTAEPSVGSASYNGSRTIVNAGTASNISVPTGCNWIAVRTASGGDVTISPTSYVIDGFVKQFTKTFKIPSGASGQPDSITLPNNTDLDTITANGLYFITSSYTYTNNPFGTGGSGYLFCFISAATRIQICIGYNTRTKIYIRDYSGGSWHEWKEYDSTVNNPAIIPEPVGLEETNLNNVFGAHLWVMSDSITYTNKPSGMTSNAGFLLVAEGSNGHTLQLLWQFTGAKHWKRRGKNAATPTWEEWQEISGITNEYNFQEYSQTLNVTATPQITADTNNYLAPSGDSTDRTADILTMLGTSGVCRLGAGNYYINGLQMPAGSAIIGSGYATKLIMSGESDGFAIQMNSQCILENFLLSGAGIDQTIGTTEGGRHGILWIGDYTQHSTAPFRGMINNVYIHRFSGAGIRCYDTGYGTNNALEVCNAYIRNCWAGIDIAYWSEFHKFTNIRCDECRIGCVNNGGNNVFVNCDFSKSLEIGILMDNSQGQSPNNTHGSCIGCVFNHIQSGGIANSGIGIKIINCGNGFMFSGCQIFYSKIVIENSNGIVIANSNFGQDNCDISVTGGGAVLFANNMFKAEPTITATSKTHFVNCYNNSTGDAITA